MKPSVVPSSKHLVIEASPTSRAADIFARLLLPRPFADNGYRLTRASAEATTFFTSPESPIGPLHYSTDTNVLFCYAVRYKNDLLGVMIISGASATPLVVNGRIQECHRHLFSQSELHGPIKQHTLTEVRTPKAKHDMSAGMLAYEDFSRLRSIFAAGLPSHPAPSNALHVNSITLSGIGRGEFPICTFFTSFDNYDLLASVSRTGRTFSKNPINLTRPEATLGSHPCIAL